MCMYISIICIRLFIYKCTYTYSLHSVININIYTIKTDIHDILSIFMSMYVLYMCLVFLS